METQPLDDRDVAPWYEADGETITEDEDAEAYQKEREDEQLDAYFAPSEPW